MDVASYTQANYGRLLEHAVELGVPDGQAAAYLDHVLLAQRSRIKRSRDPDPLVREALRKAIRGEREQDHGLLAVVVVVAVVLASVGLAAVAWAPPPQPLPSVFGLTGSQAQQLLVDEGYDVQLRPARACEPEGLVLTTTPRVGEVLPHGSAVTVRTAVPSQDQCVEPFQARADAWAFVAWAEDVGAAPAFADTVEVAVDGTPQAALVGGDALDRGRWGSALRLLVAEATRPARTTTGMPRLSVLDTVPPAAYCGSPTPPGTAGRPSLRLAIDTEPTAEAADCPLTVDLYRTSAGIDAVAVYTPGGAGS